MRSLHFIASYPRSGNTWVRTFLFHLFRDQGHIPATSTLRQVESLLPWDAHPTVYRHAMGADVGELDVAAALAARPHIHHWLSTRLKTPPAIKTHSLFGSIGGSPLFNMDVTQGALYLVRNPLDVIPSLAKLLDKTVDEAIEIAERPLYVHAGILEAAEANQSPEPGEAPDLWGSWSQNVLSWTKGGPVGTLVVRYEDLIADQTKWFSTICADMGLTFTGDEIDRAIEGASLKNIREKVASNEASPPGWNRGVVGSGAGVGYEDKLTRDQAKRIIDTHGDVMQSFGYIDDRSGHFING